MIPEYRLIRPLIKLKNNNILKKNCKKSIAFLKYSKKNKTYYFIFNSNSNSQVFNNTISLMAHLNNTDLTPFFSIITNFNYMVAAWRPAFNFQLLYYRDYDNMTKALIKQSLENSWIHEWYQEGLKNHHSALDFLINKSNIPQEIIIKIKVLTHVSGKLFQTLKDNNSKIANNFDYQLGYYLMLFYLLQLETRQTLKFNDVTNWNIKSYFNYSELFADKLKVINQLNDILMTVTEKDFNLYWRIINYALNGTFDS